MIPTVCVLAALNYGLLTQCQYVPMLDRRVAILTPKALVIGKLTAEGEFKTIRQHPIRDIGGVIFSGPPFALLNGSGVHSELVYELSGKTLVPGRMSEEGAFTQDPKGKAIPFAEYEFTATARPIWNLPGRFLPLGIHPDERPATALDESALPKLFPPKPPEGPFRMPPNFGEIPSLPPPGTTRAGFGNPSTFPPASVGGGGGRRGGAERDRR
jgi:hypothetical protein